MVHFAGNRRLEQDAFRHETTNLTNQTNENPKDVKHATAISDCEDYYAVASPEDFFKSVSYSFDSW
jgi:hypothetical protein